MPSCVEAGIFILFEPHLQTLPMEGRSHSCATLFSQGCCRAFSAGFSARMFLLILSAWDRELIQQKSGRRNRKSSLPASHWLTVSARCERNSRCLQVEGRGFSFTIPREEVVSNWDFTHQRNANIRSWYSMTLSSKRRAFFGCLAVSKHLSSC